MTRISAYPCLVCGRQDETVKLYREKPQGNQFTAYCAQHAIDNGYCPCSGGTILESTFGYAKCALNGSMNAECLKGHDKQIHDQND